MDTDLVETARVAVEQDTHRILEDLARVVLREGLFSVGAEVVEGFAEQRLREVHAEAGRDRGGRVGDAEEVDVREEPVRHHKRQNE